MGLSLSCFRQSSPRRLVDQQDMKHDRSTCNSSMSSKMLGCFGTKETKQRQLQLKEEQHQQQLKRPKEITLEDWLTASPGLQKQSGTVGGEYHVFKHSSNRIFPSFLGENTHSSSKPRQSFSKERLLKSGDDQREEMEVCLSRSQNGKSKKKVSFRLPEEADIFIFHPSSSEEESREKEI